MRDLPRILSLIRDKPNKFNDTGARLLGSIYCMTLKLFKISFSLCRMGQKKMVPCKFRDDFWLPI